MRLRRAGAVSEARQPHTRLWLAGASAAVAIAFAAGLLASGGATALMLRTHGGFSLDTKSPIVGFQNTGGAVRINETGTGLTLGGAPSFSKGGPVSLSAHSPFTFAVNFTSAGTIATTTTETASESTTPLPPPDDDITVNNGVTVESTGGDVNFTSADSVVLQPNSLVKADTGNVSFTGGSGDVDNDASMTLNGTISAPAGNVTINSPGSVCANSISAPTGTVTITSANGAITACSGGSLHITAASVVLSASTGIGSAATPLQTQTSNIGAQSSTGSVFIENGATTPTTLNISRSPGVVVSGGSGDVQLINHGTIDSLTDNDTIRGPGSVTVQALGTSADIQTGGQSSLTSIRGLGGGTVSVTAGRDLLLGDSTGFGSVRSVGGPIALTAGRNIVDNANAVVNVIGGSGSITANAGGDITMLTSPGSQPGSPEFLTAGGPVSLTTGAGGTFTGDSTGTDAVNSAGGDISINADAMSIAKGIDTGGSTARVTLEPVSANRPVDLGSKPASTLGLTSAELAQVTAGVLQVGSPAAGDLTVSAPIAAAGHYPTLSLQTGGAVVDGDPTEQPDVTVPSLAIRAGNGVGATNDLDTAVSTLALSNTSGSVAVGNTGALTIGTVDGLAGATNGGGATALTASGDITVSSGVTVNSAGGAVDLLAGDNATVQPGASVAAAGAANLSCNDGDTNPANSCTIDIPGGGVIGSPVSLTGGTDNPVTFNVADEQLSGRGPLMIDGGGGTNDVANVTSTTVNHSPGAGLVLDRLTNANVRGSTFADNTQDGIKIQNTTGGTIGGTAAGEGNTISGNGSNGITLASGSGVSFLENSIFGNHGLGIKLENGANHSQRAPTVMFAAPEGTSTRVKGSLSSTPNRSFRLEFFASSACDPSGFGQGHTFIGSATVSTSASGTGSFNALLPAHSSLTDAITATATDQTTHDTSEFSRCVQRADLALTSKGTPNPAAGGGKVTYTLMVANHGPDRSTGSRLTDTLPAGVMFNAASPGCSRSARTVTCSIGALTKGASANKTITVSAPVTKATLTNTATVAGDQQDTNPANDKTSASVSVRPSNRFSVSHLKVHRDGSVEFDAAVPGPGQIDVLETAWNPSPQARDAMVTLQPGPYRFAFARRHVNVAHAGSLHIKVLPSADGAKVVRHHRIPLYINVWITYQPGGGQPRNKAFFHVFVTN